MNFSPTTKSLDFVRLHGALLATYLAAAKSVDAGHSDDEGAADKAFAALADLRTTVPVSGCAMSVLSFEQFLDLVCLVLNRPDRRTDLTLIGEATLEVFRTDPSQPAHIVGAALYWKRQADFRRARQLLRRLAASRYPEHRLAQISIASEIEQRLQNSVPY